MSAGETCAECGTVIPTDCPGGFCPQCLLRTGLVGGGAASSATASEAESQSDGANRIGRYRLLHELGHGGCGVVYLAEQEEPVRRKVALKVIKLGMDTKEVVAR